MKVCAIQWDQIDLTFGVALPDFDVAEEAVGEPCLSIADIFDMLDRDLANATAPVRRSGPHPRSDRGTMRPARRRSPGS